MDPNQIALLIQALSQQPQQGSAISALATNTGANSLSDAATAAGYTGAAPTGGTPQAMPQTAPNMQATPVPNQGSTIVPPSNPVTPMIPQSNMLTSSPTYSSGGMLGNFPLGGSSGSVNPSYANWVLQ